MANLLLIYLVYFQQDTIILFSGDMLLVQCRNVFFLESWKAEI